MLLNTNNTCSYNSIVYQNPIKYTCTASLLPYRSQSFRPAYSRLNELRTLVPPSVLMIAATATVTKAVRDDVISKLEMQGCKLVYTSSNRPNIYYEVRPSTDIETDFAPLVSDLQCNYNKAERVIVYVDPIICVQIYMNTSCFPLGIVAIVLPVLHM